MEELDWDLWAVVKSCNNPAAAAKPPQEEPLNLSPSLVFNQNENSLWKRSYNEFEELHEVYKTFIKNSQSSINPNTSSPTSSVSPRNGFNHQLQEPPPSPLPPHVKPISNPIDRNGSERRRSHRTAVVEVEAGNLVEVDPWNWHKYGRKTIKTPPFLRNYYKCSSDGSKCPAKKYVEKSKADPEKVVVSYKGDHNHSPPRKVIRVRSSGTH